MKDYAEIKRAVSEHFRCDPMTGLVFRKVGSNRLAAGDPIGHLMKNGYMAVVVPGIRVKVYCHHVVYFLCSGKWAPEHGVMLDHRDCCRTNNAISNLREASACLNAVNSHEPSGASPYTTKGGVRYRAQLMIAGVRYARAGFLTEEEASAWYLEQKRTASTQLFGEVVGA